MENDIVKSCFESIEFYGFLKEIYPSVDKKIINVVNGKKLIPFESLNENNSELKYNNKNAFAFIIEKIYLDMIT